MKELCKNSTVLEGFTMQGGVERDGVYFVIKDEKKKEAESKVKKWLQKIKVLKEAHKGLENDDCLKFVTNSLILIIPGIAVSFVLQIDLPRY